MKKTAPYIVPSKVPSFAPQNPFRKSGRTG